MPIVLCQIWEPTFTIVYKEQPVVPMQKILASQPDATLMPHDSSDDDGDDTDDNDDEDNDDDDDGGNATPVIHSGRASNTLSPSSPALAGVHSAAPHASGTTVHHPAAPCTVDDVLSLLSQLNAINTKPAVAATAALDLSDVTGDVSTDAPLSADLFMSKKITNKLQQQIQDPLVLSSNSLPSWCEDLNQSCPFLFPFETRQLYFNCTAFGASRSIVWLQSQRDTTMDRRMTGSSPRRDDQHEFRVGRLKHDRVKVPRNESLLEWAMQVMRIHAGRKSVLEVEFLDEEGTGLGPTLEFYALVSAELQRSDLGMWLYEDEHLEETEVDLGKGAKPLGYYVRRESGLFPAPLPQDSEICERVVKYFEFLCIFLAKVLQDGRIVDLPLSNSFLQLLCHNKNLTKGSRAGVGTVPHPQTAQRRMAMLKSAEDIMISSIMSEESDRDVESSVVTNTGYGGRMDVCPEKSWYEGILGAEHLREIDGHRAEFLRELQEVCTKKMAIEQMDALSGEEKRRRVEELKLVTKTGDEVAIEDLALTFSFAPSSKVYGFEAVELVQDGNNVDVTIDTLEDYCELMTTFCLQEGIARQLQAFHRGFCQVFPLNKLAAFSPEEARIMICGEQNPEWSREDLLNYTEPKLGYTKDR